MVPAVFDPGLPGLDIYIHFLGFHINGIPQNPFLRIDKEKVMQKILDENKLVLTLDYANLRFQVEHCYRNSRSKGYVPYVSTDELDQIFFYTRKQSYRKSQ